MKWFQKLLASLALVNIVISPVLAAEWTAQEKAKLAQYRDYLEPLGYTLSVDPDSKKALVYDKNTKKLAMEIPFTEEEYENGRRDEMAERAFQEAMAAFMR